MRKTCYRPYLAEWDVSCGLQRVGAEPPPSRNREAYQSLSDTDYDSSPRPYERTLCVVLQSESEVLVVPRLEGPAALPPYVNT